MTAWINFAILLSATILLLYFYVLSARPAAREKIIGPRAYRQWFQYRLIAMAFELIIAVNYILYFFPRWRLRCPMRSPRTGRSRLRLPSRSAFRLRS